MLIQMGRVCALLALFGVLAPPGKSRAQAQGPREEWVVRREASAPGTPPDTAAAHVARLALMAAQRVASNRQVSPQASRDDAPAAESWSQVPLIGYEFSSMIIDPVHDRYVMYGGAAEQEPSADVWVKPLSGDAPWTPLAVEGPRPSARSAHLAVYDPVGERMIVYGGVAHTDDAAVWALSLSGTPRWTQIVSGASGPGISMQGCAVYDPIHRQILVFGTYAFERDQLENDLWALSLSAPAHWTLLEPSGTRPSPQTMSTAIYDPVRQRMVMFGGYDRERNTGGHSRREVWALTLTDSLAWVQLSPRGDTLQPRHACAAAYDSRRDRMIVFGGENDAGGDPILRDTWALQFGDSLDWSQLEAQNPPSPRATTTTVYDATRDRLVFYGGKTSDTWALPLGAELRWTLLEPGDGLTFPPRNLHAAVFDAARHRTLVYGGRLAQASPYNGRRQLVVMSDLWSLAMEPRPTWTQVSSDSLPPARWGHSMILDPASDQLIAFGGVEHSATTGEEAATNALWRAPLPTGSGWSAVPTGDSVPPARAMHSAVLDPVRRRMLVFGGTRDREVLGDLWALSLDGAPQWTRLAPAGDGPGPRFGHGAVYDAAGDRMIVFGGDDGSGKLNDTWQLSFGGEPAWAPIPSAIRPSARMNATMVYDPRRQRIVLFGGHLQDETGAEAERASDTWILPLAEGASWAPAAMNGDIPQAREGAAGVFDSERDQVLLLQGQVDEYSGNDSGFDSWALASSALVPRPLSLVRAQAGPWRVLLQWQGGQSNQVATVERRTNSSPWTPVGAVQSGVDGILQFEDTRARPETRYFYRMTWVAGAAAGSTAAVEVFVPRLRFTLIGASPNPAPRGLTVYLSLPDAASAKLELWDVAGRRVASRDVGALGPGDHVVALAARDALPPGIYLIRLTRGGSSLVTRACVIR
jgi:hypothetical protein